MCVIFREFFLPETLHLYIQTVWMNRSFVMLINILISLQRKTGCQRRFCLYDFIHLYHIYLSLNNKHQYTAVHVCYAILYIFLFIKYFSILGIHSIVFFDDNEILPVEPLNLNCSGRLCKDLNLCMSTSSSSEPTFLP